MTTPTTQPTTITELALTMFTVSDQDAARTFYTEVLGFEVRSDDRFGENGEMRWLVARGDVDVDAEPVQTPGAPLLFMLRDPDGNVIVVVETATSAPS
jgi:lactoylglutathione lyase